MENLLTLLSKEPLTIVSNLIAIAGITLAYVFYRRSRRSKDPSWAIRNTVLIEGYSTNFTDLRVVYKESVVENLSVSRVAFWNNGFETINGSDIALANPLRVVAGPSRPILDAKILATNNPSSQFTAVLNTDLAAVTLSFDYLDYGQGAVIQIVHTGTTSRDLSLQGDIKGARHLCKKEIHVWSGIPLPTPASLDKRISPAGRRKIRASLLFVVAFASLAMIVFLAAIHGDLHQRLPDIVICLILVFYFFVSFFLGLWIWLTRPPSGLEVFEDDIDT